MTINNKSLHKIAAHNSMVIRFSHHITVRTKFNKELNIIWQIATHNVYHVEIIDILINKKTGNKSDIFEN